MSVLDPRELEASPLADLHALAAELGIEGFRRLRKAELIKQIIAVQGGTAPSADDDGAAEAEDKPAAEPEEKPAAAEEEGTEKPEAEERPKRRRGIRRRKKDEDEAPAAEDGATDEGAGAEDPALGRETVIEAAAAESQREDEKEGAGEQEEAAEPEEQRTGVLDVLPNGSGFIRAEPFRQSREDVYVSPAQIRRCELRPGDEVAGPVRPPRRNERHPSLVRVDTVNGSPAEPPSERGRFDELTAVWPKERLAGPNALSATPFGKGSRVAIGGPPGSGATGLLREAVKVLRDRHSDLEVIVVLAGVRPEEVVEWNELGVQVAGGSFEGSADEQGQVAELAVQRAKRAAESGRDAVVVIDSLDALAPAVARRVFGAGRNTEQAGSVTVLASTGMAAEPHRMATTRITLEPADGSGEPKVASLSGTLRRDALG